VNRGNVAFLAGDFTRAIQYYTKVLDEMGEVKSDKIDVPVMLLLNISKAYYRNEQFDEAWTFYERAKESDPEAAKNYGYLGTADAEGGGRSADARAAGTIMFAEGEEE